MVYNYLAKLCKKHNNFEEKKTYLLVVEASKNYHGIRL